MEKLTIEEMKELARSRGGKCLSKEYVDRRTKLKWQCEEGHVWKATPGHIKHGTWCPKCSIKSKADKQRGNIEGMQKIAKVRGGKCLSKEYIDNRTKLKWQCKEGHTWEARPNSIKRGTWCPKCSIKFVADKHRGSIEDMREMAEAKDGKCLSEKYINNSTKLTWQCKEGHIWEAISNNIKSGRWCPKCSIKFRADKHRGNIEEMRKISEARSGKCLSKRYIGAHTKIKWQCKEGHIWKSKSSNIKSGTWCPYCAGKY